MTLALGFEILGWFLQFDEIDFVIKIDFLSAVVIRHQKQETWCFKNPCNFHLFKKIIISPKSYQLTRSTTWINQLPHILIHSHSISCFRDSSSKASNRLVSSFNWWHSPSYPIQFHLMLLALAFILRKWAGRCRADLTAVKCLIQSSRARSQKLTRRSEPTNPS